MIDRCQEIMDLVFTVAFTIVFVLFIPSGLYAVLFSIVYVICGFTPFGWRYTHNTVNTSGLRGLAIKLIISVLISVIAGPITLGRDINSIVSYIRYK